MRYNLSGPCTGVHDRKTALCLGVTPSGGTTSSLSRFFSRGTDQGSEVTDRKESCYSIFYRYSAWRYDITVHPFFRFADGAVHRPTTQKDPPGITFKIKPKNRR